MRKNSLTPNKGLSLSQAQTISNLCNQSALEIARQLNAVNNYSKSVNVNGVDKVTVIGNKMPSDVTTKLMKMSKYYATQAFLMENIKAKDDLLKEIKTASADISSVELPISSEQFAPERISDVDEEWGWSQLSVSEMCKYLEAEAYASHIGQFIHRGKNKVNGLRVGILSDLREELSTIPAIEWMELKKDEKTPITITVHHNSHLLLTLHNELADFHREYEQTVNYFKAKVKNLVTKENARIASLNADAQHDAEKKNNESQLAFQTASIVASNKIKTIRAEFEKVRQASVKEIASMRIDVDPRFQSVVDEFLPKINKTEVNE
jgi:hypothetical protein